MKILFDTNQLEEDIKDDGLFLDSEIYVWFEREYVISIGLYLSIIEL